jgi:nucleoside-diphosphate-sugar epimerase
MTPTSTILVFGATGGTGQHFTRMALREGHIVRAFVRKPLKLQHLQQESNLHLYTGSITDVPNLDELVKGVDYIVAMLGDVQAQRTEKINLSFVEKLIPSMRKNNVKTFFYQAGGLSKPYNEPLSPLLWILRNTMISFLGYGGQHQDNEAVMKYLELNAKDIDWIVHRAGISSNGPTKGTLIRSKDTFSVATFQDCAAYNSKTMMDQSAVHTCHLSTYT